MRSERERKRARRCRRQNQEIEQYAVHGACSFPGINCCCHARRLSIAFWASVSDVTGEATKCRYTYIGWGSREQGERRKRWDSTSTSTSHENVQSNPEQNHSLVYSLWTIGFNVSSITEHRVLIITVQGLATTTGSSIVGGSENLDMECCSTTTARHRRRC